jgi:hypothetical protein
LNRSVRIAPFSDRGYGPGIFGGRSVRGWVVGWVLAFGSAAVAAPPGVPAHLPKYDLRLDLSTIDHTARLTATITWTNPATHPTAELILNFYPQYRVPDGDHLLLAKTLELLRVTPSQGIDRGGKHGEIVSVTYDDQPLQFRQRTENLTAVVVDLPRPVGPGEAVTIVVSAKYTLPNKQGRWGYWEGITTFANAIPVVAFFDDAGWHAMPFVPWHQPFWNEAGVYTATVRVSQGQTLACSAIETGRTIDDAGWQVVTYAPFVGRDFALVASDDFKIFTKRITQPDGRPLTIRCAAFERHAHYANEILTMVADAVPTFTDWFGPFPYEQFTIAESFFGWNGNECGGLVLIDERIFGMPHLGRGYVEYLVSHEFCHQWWYNLVGTNGFAETFIDEGAATHFTHKYMDRKRGRNNAMLEWPDQAKWLPNIQRDNYRNASMIGAIRRGEMHSAAGELPGFNHLVGLFTAAYDRGSKVFGMIEQRLGEAAFLDFIRATVAKYSWQVLSAASLRGELEAYTGRSWGDFFEQWVYGKGMSDWELVSAEVSPRSHQFEASVGLFSLPSFSGQTAPGERRVTVHVRQNGTIDEPTMIGVSLKAGDGFPIRIPIGPGHQAYAQGDIDVEPTGPKTAKVSFTVPGEPHQITIDPDRVVLDSDPVNNSWRSAPNRKLVPLYTMLNETDLTNDYDRWNLAAGPWVGGALYPDPWYTRSSMLGVRAGAFRTQFFAGGLYAAVRADYRDAVVGADGLFDHEPFARTQMGYNVEKRVGGPWWSNDGADGALRASFFARYVFQYHSSLYLAPLHYAESFATYQDNFLPIARSKLAMGDRPDRTWLSGLHYRLNLLTPYWDPESGVWVDAVYAGGTASLPRGTGPVETVAAHQLRGELATVIALPECLPLVGGARVAGRGVVMSSFPDRGQFFALGGGTLFRGFDLAERQGSQLWVTNVELRLPLKRNVEWDVLDHTAGARNVWLAAFYDAGAVYTRTDRVGNVAHAFGAGLRVDGSIFSFMERATLRLDVAKTINAESPVQVWFGVQHPF